MTLACLVSFATPPASIPMDRVESMVSSQLPRKARSEPRSRTPHKSAATDSVDGIHRQLNTKNEYRADRRNTQPFENLHLPQTGYGQWQAHESTRANCNRADRAERLLQEHIVCTVIGRLCSVNDAEDDKDHKRHNDGENHHIHIPHAELQLGFQICEKSVSCVHLLIRKLQISVLKAFAATLLLCLLHGSAENGRTLFQNADLITQRFHFIHKVRRQENRKSLPL